MTEIKMTKISPPPRSPSPPPSVATPATRLANFCDFTKNLAKEYETEMMKGAISHRVHRLYEWIDAKAKAAGIEATNFHLTEDCETTNMPLAVTDGIPLSWRVPETRDEWGPGLDLCLKIGAFDLVFIIDMTTAELLCRTKLVSDSMETDCEGYFLSSKYVQDCTHNTFFDFGAVYAVSNAARAQADLEDLRVILDAAGISLPIERMIRNIGGKVDA